MKTLLTLLLVCLTPSAWSTLPYPSKSSLCVAYIAEQAAMERQLGRKDTRDKTLETLRDFRVSVQGRSRQATLYKPVHANWVSGSLANVAERIGGIESDKRLERGPQIFASSFHGKREIEGFIGQLDQKRAFAERILRTQFNRFFWVSSAGFFSGIGAVTLAEALRTGGVDPVVASLAAFASAVDFVAGVASATDFSHVQNRGQLVAFLSRDPSEADPDEWSYTGRNYKMRKTLVAALQDASPDVRLISAGLTQGNRDHHNVAVGVPMALSDRIRGDQPYSAVLVDEFLHRHAETGEPVFSFVLRIYQDRPPGPRRRRFTERLADWGREGLEALLPPSVVPSPQPAP
jgi:hypothetical protein